MSEDQCKVEKPAVVQRKVELSEQQRMVIMAMRIRERVDHLGQAFQTVIADVDEDQTEEFWRGFLLQLIAGLQIALEDLEKQMPEGGRRILIPGRD